MGPSDLHLLPMYFERLQMMMPAGGHYEEPSHRERGITQGDLMSTTIFNVVVDAVVHHLESLLAERAGGGVSAMMR